MPGIFNSCVGGLKLKEQAGIDIIIMLMPRDQIKDSGTAFCDNYVGPSGPQCFLRETACDGVCGGTNLGLAISKSMAER